MPMLPAVAGLSRQQHLQIEGPPGVGKTKLSVGIAVRARAASLSTARFREEVEVLFIDADGSGGSKLIAQAAQALTKAECQNDPDDVSMTEKICAGIHCVRITSAAELGFFFHKLPHWLESHTKVKLVILDSITAHTRYVSMSISDRSVIARIVKDSLMAASSGHDCAIIVTSQLTARSAGSSAYGQGAVLVPPDFKANAWSTSKMWRIILMYDQDGTRKASVMVEDFPVEPKTKILFDLNPIGILDPLVPP